jgi:hypothetical protein
VNAIPEPARPSAGQRGERLVHNGIGAAVERCTCTYMPRIVAQPPLDVSQLRRWQVRPLPAHVPRRSVTTQRAAPCPGRARTLGLAHSPSTRGDAGLSLPSRFLWTANPGPLVSIGVRYHALVRGTSDAWWVVSRDAAAHQHARCLGRESRNVCANPYGYEPWKAADTTSGSVYITTSEAARDQWRCHF